MNRQTSETGFGSKVTTKSNITKEIIQSCCERGEVLEAAWLEMLLKSPRMTESMSTDELERCKYCFFHSAFFILGILHSPMPKENKNRSINMITGEMIRFKEQILDSEEIKPSS